MTRPPNLPAENASRVLHGYLVAWLEQSGCINKGKRVLLMTEPQAVKRMFNSKYPADFVTCGIDDNSDVQWDVCKEAQFTMQFDGILSQSLLEHIP